MKTVYMIIGIMLVLALCISPVAAYSTTTGAGFVAPWDEYGFYEKYKYRHLYNQSETYTVLWTKGTRYFDSITTFKPVNIPDAPTMVVRTHNNAHMNKYDKIYFYLPQSVDEWIIKYYSSMGRLECNYSKYLKNAGVVNLNEYFKNCISMELELHLSVGQTIVGKGPRNSAYSWDIPDVD